MLIDSIFFSPFLSSPVSPVSPAPITSPTSPTNNFLKTEPITPPQETTEDNNQKSDGNDENNDPATPLAEKTRILKLSGDSGRKSRNRIEPDEDKDNGVSTIEDFTNRPNARNVRFFVIKSFSERHLQISIDKGIWATQRHNEIKLNDAYKKSDVVLVFSVNESRHFQGYAQMISRIGGQRPANNVWTDSKDEGVWGSSFEVKWLQLHNLPFTETLHLRNPMNEDKPVKISRDGTELAMDTAMALCSLIDKGAAKSDKKRKPFDSGDGVGESKRNRNFEAPPRAHEFLPLPPPTSRRIVLPPHTPLPHPSMLPFNPRNGYSHTPSGGHMSSRHSDRHSTNYHSNNSNYSNHHSNHHSNYNNFHPPHFNNNNNNNNGPAYSRGPFSSSSSSSSSSFVPSSSSSRHLPFSSFNERYAPRHDSPPSKRIRSRSHSPPPFHPHPPPFHSLKSSGGFHNHPYHGDRKRKDREDDNDRRDRGRGRDDRDLDHKDRERERGRDREYERDRERGERADRGDRGDRDRDRERDSERDKDRERDRARDRDRRDSRDKIRSSNDSSPPPDLLNMSYEDYLRALAKYRRLPSAVPGGGGAGGAVGGPWGLGGTAISERDYMQYMDMISKLGSAASLFPFSDKRAPP